MAESPVALVTGSTRGIGLATARLLARRGYCVVVSGRSEGPALDAAAQQVAAEGGPPPLALAMDVRQPDQVAAVYRAIFQQHHRLDLLVNNAGIMVPGLLGMVPAATIEDTLAVNTAGALHNLQAAARLMARKQRGCIVNLCSAVGLQGAAGSVVYAASKSAIVGMTLAAARELGPKGIRVNAVAPGLVDTDLVADQTPQQRARVVSGIALGRIGSPDEIAEVISFLASPAAAYVTGQVIGVDGGLVLPL